MFRSTVCIAWCLIAIGSNEVKGQFEKPNIVVEALSPAGLRVSIKDEPGLQLFAFHGKINEEFIGREAGTFSKDVASSANGRWTFVDKNVALKIGDVVYYWITVQYFDGETRQSFEYDGSSNIAGFIPDDGEGFNGFRIPDVHIEPLTPRGLRASISNVPGIKLFSFHCNVNKPFKGKEAGDHSKDILREINGRWTYHDKTIKLAKGDIVYYWYYILHSEENSVPIGHEKTGQSFRVEELLVDQPTTTTMRTTTTKKTKPTTIKTTTLRPGCDPTPTKINGGKTTCMNKLLFQDNFAGVSEAKWETEIRFAGAPDYEFVTYMNSPDIIHTTKNILTIKPLFADDKFGAGFSITPNELDLGINCTGEVDTLDCVQKPQAFLILPPVLSAKINTSPHLSFKYGKVEIRAKLPKGDWIYPEISLTPKHYEYGKGLESGKIRIAFLPGNRNMSQTLSGGVVLGHKPLARTFGMKSIQSENHWNDAFHIYTLKWTPDAITVSVDDVVYGNIVPPPGGFASESDRLNLTAAKRWKQGTMMAPFDQEMILNIGVGVGGHIFPDQTEGKPWVNGDPKSQRRFYTSKDVWKGTWTKESALEVDYVKIWAI